MARYWSMGVTWEGELRLFFQFVEYNICEKNVFIHSEFWAIGVDNMHFYFLKVFVRDYSWEAKIIMSSWRCQL